MKINYFPLDISINDEITPDYLRNKILDLHEKKKSHPSRSLNLDNANNKIRLQRIEQSIVNLADSYKELVEFPNLTVTPSRISHNPRIGYNRAAFFDSSNNSFAIAFSIPTHFTISLDSCYQTIYFRQAGADNDRIYDTPEPYDPSLSTDRCDPRPWSFRLPIPTLHFKFIVNLNAYSSNPFVLTQVYNLSSSGSRLWFLSNKGCFGNYTDYYKTGINPVVHGINSYFSSTFNLDMYGTSITRYLMGKNIRKMFSLPSNTSPLDLLHHWEKIPLEDVHLLTESDTSKVPVLV